MRKLFAAALAASLSVAAAGPGWGQEVPLGGANPNQQLADAITARLRQSPLLRHYHVTVVVQHGEADLSGTVLAAAQHAEVLRLAQSVPGILRVRDRLLLAPPSGVVQAQAAPILSPFQPIPVQGKELPKAIQEPNKKDGMGINPLPPFPPGVQPPGTFPPGTVPPGAFPPGTVPPGAMPPGGPYPGAGGIPAPLPLHGAPPGFPSATQPPPMPPYAWPTYAPYNNYSRVAYPNLYPYESFPFIGPIYPFPRVPLGWRSVSLTWEDGHWWYGRNATGHDWWRIRYW